MATDYGQFALDTGCVIWMRSLQMAQGGKGANDELRLMVTEKIAAHSDFASKLFRGEVGSDPQSLINGTMAHYAPKVRRNRQRLSKVR